MKVNTLVVHKKLKSLGIGCIAKVHSKHYTVNWGTDQHTKCNQTSVVEVDTSKCSTVSWNTVKERPIMTKGIDKAIVGNELWEYVGIGWVTLRAITEDDLYKYPRVI